MQYWSFYKVRLLTVLFLNPTIQRRTDLQKYLRCDMAIPPHFSHRRRADARLFTQVLFLHILIDEQLPEFFNSQA